ncbi:hypothetical protein ACFX2J_032822 [Malus domestica]
MNIDICDSINSHRWYEASEECDPIEERTPDDEIPEKGDSEEILEDDDNEMFDGEGQLPNDGWFEDHNLTTGNIIRTDDLSGSFEVDYVNSQVQAIQILYGMIPEDGQEFKDFLIPVAMINLYNIGRNLEKSRPML